MPVAAPGIGTGTPDRRVSTTCGTLGLCERPWCAARCPELCSVPGDLSAPAPALRAPSAPSGDLGLAQPMSRPNCNGQGIVVLGSVTTPGQYAAGVQRLLAAHPGASYPRTDQTCPSLRAATDQGNPIYAVYRPAGATVAEVCVAVRSAGGDAYGKWLDYTIDPSSRIPC
jgi:serine/threonine-protein kinase